jgi:hypothetical protein
MIIPETTRDRDQYLSWVLNTCLQSRRERKDMYDRRREFFLYGTGHDQDVLYNRIESHLDLVCSFLFAPDHAEFALSAKANADEDVVRQFAAAQDQFNEDFRDAGLFDAFADLLLWSTTFDTTLGKIGWSIPRKQLTCELIPPWEFGVFAEERTELDDQEAFVHSYHLDYDVARQRLERAGLGDKVKALRVVNTPFASPFPELLTRMIIASTAGENLGGNVTGSVNPSYIQRPSYRAKVDRPLVQLHELYVWDDEYQDYRLFSVLDSNVVLADSKKTIDALKKAEEWPKNARGLAKQQLQFYDTATNLYCAGRHPFVQVSPYGIYQYFWGKAHIESLIPLQEWSNERLQQIHDILDRQAYPPRIGAGFMGLTDEKMEAFGGADTFVIDQLPQATIKELYPQMPEDIFADYMQIGMLFMEASGLTEILAGKDAGGGVRSKGHAKDLAKTGGGRIRKAATRLEAPLVSMGSLSLAMLQKNSTEMIVPDPMPAGGPGAPFLYWNLAEDFTLRIDGHSHSPLFADDARELALVLFKTGAINHEWLLRLTRAPNRTNLIAALRERERKQAQSAAMRMKMGLLPPGEKAPAKGKGGGAQAPVM